MLRNEKGFTLIEIIAVLVILGILAAVAIPKYLDISEQARILAAQGAIAEVKGRLSSAQAKYMMANTGTAPTAAVLVPYAAGANGYLSPANLVNVGPNFTIAELVSTAANIQITVNQVQGKDITPVSGGFLTANGT